MAINMQTTSDTREKKILCDALCKDHFKNKGFRLQTEFIQFQSIKHSRFNEFQMAEVFGGLPSSIMF